VDEGIMEIEKGKRSISLARGKEMGKEQASMEEEIIKNKGRKKKEISEEINSNKEQNKFFIDVSKDSESKEMILNLLTQANSKSYGKEIILKDLVLMSLPKLTVKDIEKIQENSLTGMEKVERALDEYNKKSETKLTLEEFLVKKLGIN
jgi:hypothetical protein